MNACESIICEHLLSADNPMAIGERRSRPVSMTPRSVICSFQILIIVSLKAATYFCRSSMACCSVICLVMMQRYLATIWHGKTLVLCQMWMENQKKNERNVENVVRKM